MHAAHWWLVKIHCTVTLSQLAMTRATMRPLTSDVPECAGVLLAGLVFVGLDQVRHDLAEFAYVVLGQRLGEIAPG